MQQLKQLVKNKKNAEQEIKQLREEKDGIKAASTVTQKAINEHVKQIFRLHDEVQELEKEIKEKTSDLGLS